MVINTSQRTSEAQTRPDFATGIEEKTQTKESLMLEQVSIQRAVASTLVKISKQTDEEKKYADAKDVLDMGLANIVALQEQLYARNLQGINLESERAKRKAGLLAEVCATIALERLGFKVLDSTAKEDLSYGVDIYAAAPAQYGEGQLWAIQVKAYNDLEETLVENPKEQQTKTKSLAFLNDERYASTGKSEDALLNYVGDDKTGPYANHPEFVDEYWVRPVVIRVPSGTKAAVFKRNGEPVANFPSELQKAINATFPPKN